MKKLWGILVIVLVLFIPSFAFAAPDYVIKSNDIAIVVNENNTYQITEKITADFSESVGETHGITRTLPVDVSVKRVIDNNIVESGHHAIVKDVSANVPFSTDKNSGNLVLRLGDPDVTVTGVQQYEYSYLYDVGQDNLKNMDEFYYNFISPTSQIPIEKLMFSIVMPKPFDASNIGFTTGTGDNTTYNEDALHFTVEGQTIRGEVTNLQSGEGVNIRLTLPEGYYVGARTSTGEIIPFFVLGAVLLVLALVFLALVGKRKKEVRTVEFGAPEGMTPADVGYIIDGEAQDKDVVSLLIYWADQGYLAIHQQDKNDIVFKKLQSLPETSNDYEKALFGKMFVLSDSISIKSMQYEFADTVQSAKRHIKLKYNTEKNRVMTKKSVVLEYLMAVLAAVPLALATVFYMYFDTLDTFISIFPGIMIWIVSSIAALLVCDARDSWKSAKKSSRTVKLVVGILLLLAVAVFVTFLCFDVFAWWTVILGVFMLATVLIATGLRRRTEQGAQWAGRILGLKQFIETVEAKKLEMMVNDDPSYFYHILPYAYVLGVSDRWAKQFERIATEPPHWYYGYGSYTFTTVWFASRLHHCLSFAQSNMTSSVNSGGTGAGGGGISGGGMGGGSFGRW